MGEITRRLQTLHHVLVKDEQAVERWGRGVLLSTTVALASAAHELAELVGLPWIERHLKISGVVLALMAGFLLAREPRRASAAAAHGVAAAAAAVAAAAAKAARGAATAAEAAASVAAAVAAAHPPDSAPKGDSSC
jgi:hypothetical protein